MLKSVPFSRVGSSSDQIDIEDIKDGVLKLPGNIYRLVLSVSSINFELKSEDEQDTIIDTFEGFLNSINFTIQILIRTREIDMDGYIANLDQKIASEADTPIYNEQLKNYRHFISTLISSNNILSRQFYVIVPFDPPKNLDKSFINDQLNLRADIVSKNLARLGISSRQLSSIELVDLFYSFYCPTQVKTQPISETALKVMNHEFILSEGQL